MTLHTYDVDQRSEEWFALRRGLVTASNVGALISTDAPDPLEVPCPTCPAKAKELCLSAARKTPTPIKTAHDARAMKAAVLPPIYRPAKTEAAQKLTAALAAERITNHTEETFVSNAMWRGITDEPFAVDVYSRHFAPVETVGFMVEDKWGFSIGYSPDGLVGDGGLIEVKSRGQGTQLLHTVGGEVPAYNMAQLQCGLLVTGRSWVDYVSFCGGMRLWRKRIYPDPRWHEAILAAAAQFETNAAELIAAYDVATDGMPMTERIDLELVI